MKKCTALFIIILLALGIYYAVSAAEEELNGGEFIMKLVESMGLGYKLPEGAVVSDYIKLLEEEGFVLPANFDPAKPVTIDQKADLFSQILRLDQLKKEKSQMEVYRNKAIIQKIEGSAMVKRGGTDEWIPAQLDMVLTEKDWIKTGQGSTILLRIGVAGIVEIRENSELLLKTIATQVNKKAENILIYLALGEINVDVRYIHKDTVFEAHTPTTIAAVRGTIYTVKVTPVEGKTEIREQR